MKKAQKQAAKGGGLGGAQLEELYELVVDTAKQNLQSAMEAWQNLAKADNVPAAIENQTQYVNETVARNMDACRQMCEMSMNGMKESYEPFARNMKESFDKFKLNPIS